MSRLTRDEHLSPEFDTTWSTYDLDPKTRALLTFAKKLTVAPSTIENADVDAVRATGFDDKAIYEATALVAFLNFSGRMEAAAGLPMDEVPPTAHPPEAGGA